MRKITFGAGVVLVLAAFVLGRLSAQDSATGPAPSCTMCPADFVPKAVVMACHKRPARPTGCFAATVGLVFEATVFPVDVVFLALFEHRAIVMGPDHARCRGQVARCCRARGHFQFHGVDARCPRQRDRNDGAARSELCGRQAEHFRPVLPVSCRRFCKAIRGK